MGRLIGGRLLRRAEVEVLMDPGSIDVCEVAEQVEQFCAYPHQGERETGSLIKIDIV